MLDKFRGIAERMWSVAENLQDKGIHKHIPYIGESGEMLLAMKTEVQLVIFAIVGEALGVAQITFLQEVLDIPANEENSEEYFEYICCMGIENYNSLLPYLCVMDKYTGTELAQTYLDFMSAMVTGCMKYAPSIPDEMLQRYCSIMESCKMLIEEWLGCECSLEPFGLWSVDVRKSIEKMCKDQKTQEKDGELYEVILKTFEIEIREAGRKTALEEYIVALKDDESNKKQSCIVGAELTDHQEQNTQFTEEAKKELERLVGLSEVKWQVESMINLSKIGLECKKRGINRQPISYHMIFVGNPGTGKTTVARLMAEVYHSLGILSKGHLVEVSRSDLVGEYVGHTAVKVQKVLNNAKGGILFIDEAYSLVHTNTNRNDFGYEAIATLMKGMEDNRDDMVVIAAGYPELMAKFLDSNPGLVSRFAKTIYFPDYSVEELGLIFSKMCEDNSIQYGTSVMERVLGYFDQEASLKTANFGNARMVRNFFEAILLNQANRLVQEGKITDSMLQHIVLEDIPIKKYIDKK